MDELETKITFDPPRYVTFKPVNEEQIKEVTIANAHNQPVMFKMKTTRPGVFKMKPVFFSLQPKTKKTIKLHYSGCPNGVKPNLKDRFSVIMAIVPKDAPTDWDVEKVWEDQKMQVELADSVRRKVLRIHYEGYEVDRVPCPLMRPRRARRRFSAAAQATAHGTHAVQPIVYIVYQGLPPREDVEAK
ncbi:hypothetical protein PRIPAC_81826 [Pristionchus pacificus]|uniref:Major sperm protein n=1 Tax=Pristionchus pacificus TaxID=54126 RepID=A0A2A6BHD4_PRIPA|nr:hypothetical protein PRIPAC_81826 [Pristionchus pacificus]|eukprot:PDM65299.1 MSP domain-containing protein [Pristionchus pacificus]